MNNAVRKDGWAPMDRRRAAQLLGLGGTLILPGVGSPRSARASSMPLVYTWEGYNSAPIHQEFADNFGAPPEFSLFTSLEEALAKLRLGFQADVTTPGAESVLQWRDAGLLRPIDTSKLSHFSDILDGLKTRNPAVIDGTQWAVPFCWGATAVIVRTDLVPDYEANPSWGILWDEKYAGRIAAKDGAPESVVTAALMEGIADPFDMTDEQIEQVRARLEAQRPLLRFYWDDGTSLAQAIASGEVVAALGWTATFSSLKNEGVPVTFAAPKEGALTWIDLISILTSGDADEASRYAVIDSMTTPEAGEFVINEFGVAAANRKAYGMVDPAQIETLGLTDPEATAGTGVFLRAFSPATNQKVIDMFNEVKAG
ncbi:MAG: extracellular solute-binding protein [Alphaproteobacteria bacterium]|nr:extracellular solute-binding protein [Alphaproteobacteria bacterium]